MGIILSPFLYQPRPGYISYYCPGCETMKILRLKNGEEKPGESSWVMTGTLECPGFHPSVNLGIGHYAKNQPLPPHCEECIDAKIDKRESLCLRCHSWVSNGTIQFLSDCTHSLANKTVMLPPLPKHLTENLSTKS